MSLEKESPYIFYEIDQRNVHPVNADNSNAPSSPPQEEHFHFGVFSEKLKLTKSSVQSLITFNCDIKFPKGFLSL